MRDSDVTPLPGLRVPSTDVTCRERTSGACSTGLLNKFVLASAYDFSTSRSRRANRELGIFFSMRCKMNTFFPLSAVDSTIWGMIFLFLHEAEANWGVCTYA